ncbi:MULTISPECIES: RNA polymerase sigma-70 factor [unclassified Carboxylicivirga]|uniref:RNA polymerase sigma-70 factor n=1 Tax=Carboxylicivirga TaxID=1628153 RepID=UPI003D33FCE0
MLVLQTIDIDRLKSGDEQAFEVLYKASFNALFFFAIQYVNSDAEAENLVQETFLALWTNKENLSCVNTASIKSWLYTSLKNKCINHLERENTKRHYTEYQIRQNQIHIEVLDQLDLSDVAFDEIQHLLKKSLEQMPSQCRKVFELSRFQGLRNKAIAKQLNISVKAVEANITRALKLLRVQLKDYIDVCCLLGVFSNFF